VSSLSLHKVATGMSLLSLRKFSNGMSLCLHKFVSGLSLCLRKVATGLSLLCSHKFALECCHCFTAGFYPVLIYYSPQNIWSKQIKVLNFHLKFESQSILSFGTE
jgi:hypothetical protein